MATTKIDWCDKVWNPVTGCSPISEGCKNCYAARMSKRLAGRFGYDKENPFKITYHPDRLELPKKWKKPCRIFVNSMGDFFNDAYSFPDRTRIIDVIRENPQHIFIILTKRASYMKHWINCLMRAFAKAKYEPIKNIPQNLWIGVTTENWLRAEERIPLLLQIAASVRFVSVEPMLGPVDLKSYLTGKNHLEWVIAGPETGPRKRPCKIEWAEDLEFQCRKYGVPFFWKGKEPLPCGERKQFPEVK